jgi:hypothetical protein
MRASLLGQHHGRRAVWSDWPSLESCPTSVADSGRYSARRNHEADGDALRVVLLPKIPCPKPTAGDLRRSPHPAGHTGTAKKTAVCSGCGTRHRTFYDRTTRRVRDTDAAGWRIYLVFEQRRVACSHCQGVKVERLDWLAQNPRYTQRFAHQVVSADAISPQIAELKSPLNTESQCPFTDHPDGGGTDAAKGGRDGDSGVSKTRIVSV